MKIVKNFFRAFMRRLNRNNISIDHNMNLIRKNRVNLEYYNQNINLGDLLSPIVVKYMLKKRNIDENKQVQSTKHLYAIGSILHLGYQDGTVWGSGILNEEHLGKIRKGYKIGRKLDIRAVRGPYTRNILVEAGYSCAEVYGDPAIIMPYIYNPQIEKEYECSIICHFLGKVDEEFIRKNNIHIINIATDDYEMFIDEVVASKKIISSSLHGIILAESYGVPALLVAKDVKSQMVKFYDWYESTGRENFVIASSYEQAVKLNPTQLPNLEKMRDTLIKTFPYDLWEC